MPSPKAAWLGVVCAVLLAQDSPAPDKPATVEGTVINSVTGEPILRAHVTLYNYASGGSPQTVNSLTDAAGKFTFTGLAPGSYVPAVERTGFTPAPGPNGAFMQAIQLQAGDKKDSLQLKMIPDGSISGRVVDPDGEPMESVNVTVESVVGMNAQAVTDSEGRFRLGGLAPARYYLSASRPQENLPPEIRSDGSVEQHFITTWYPNSPDRKSASRVQVRPGAEISAVEIRMQAAPIICIKGTVAGIPKGAERVMVELRQGRNGSSFGVVHSDGTFVVWRVDPGTYQVAAAWMSEGRNLRSAAVTVEVAGANVEHVDLRMIPPADIAGQLAYESEAAKQPPAQPGRQGPPGVPAPRLFVYGVDADQPPRATALADDGSFRLQDVQPGQYRLRLNYSAGYVKSMRLGQAEMQGDLLDVRNGVPPGATLNVLICVATGEISGTVADSKGPAAHVSVALFRNDDQTWSPPVSVTTTGDDGTYKFTALAPGTYKLLSPNSRAIRPLRALLDDYDDVIETVDLHDGDKVQKDLKRKPADVQP